MPNLTLPRTNSMEDPKKVYTEVEADEHAMLVMLAKKEDRPVKELVRHIIRMALQEKVLAGELVAVGGYVPPAEVIK